MKHEMVEKVVKICAAFVAHTRKAHDDVLVLNEQSTNARIDVSEEKEPSEASGGFKKCKTTKASTKPSK